MRRLRAHGRAARGRCAPCRGSPSSSGSTSATCRATSMPDERRHRDVEDRDVGLRSPGSSRALPRRRAPARRARLSTRGTARRSRARPDGRRRGRTSARARARPARGVGSSPTSRPIALDERVHRERLLQERSAGPELQRLGRLLVMAGDEDDRQVGVVLADLPREPAAAEARHDDVGDDAVDLRRGAPRRARAPRRRRRPRARRSRRSSRICSVRSRTISSSSASRIVRASRLGPARPRRGR